MSYDSTWVLKKKCFLCGNPAELEWGNIMMHGGSPICQRCAYEEQLDHALERLAAIPDLQENLEKSGGRRTKTICGYIRSVVMGSGDSDLLGKLCILEKGHSDGHDLG